MICCIIIITDLVIWRLMSFPVVSICRLSKPGKTNLALSALTSNLQLLKTFSQNASKVWWSRRLLKPGKTKLAPVHTGDQWLPPVHWALFLGFGPTTRDQPPFFFVFRASHLGDTRITFILIDNHFMWLAFQQQEINLLASACLSALVIIFIHCQSALKSLDFRLFLIVLVAVQSRKRRKILYFLQKRLVIKTSLSSILWRNKTNFMGKFLQEN